MALSPATASADSASISVRDAGNGEIEADISVTSTSCAGTPGYELFCDWYAYALERHSSLACSDDETFLRWFSPFSEDPGTVQRTFTFRPFFPRSTRLCVVMWQVGGGNRVVGDLLINLPDGYGVQRSSGYNCSDFGSRASAQYYFQLYPGDPSGLDGDNDGAACEANPCPCGAEAIPAEPLPKAEPLPTFPKQFSLGKVRKNKRKGTATMTVKVPGPGQLDLKKTRKVKGATAESEAGEKKKLAIKPRGSTRTKLRKTGKAKVNAQVTFTPDTGATKKKSKKVRLVWR